MASKLLRATRILLSQLKILSFYEIVSLLRNSLFRVETIIIYVRELDTGPLPSLDRHLDGYIRKGEVSEIENARKSMTSPPWEFCCHLYDRVTDFFVFK